MGPENTNMPGVAGGSPIVSGGNDSQKKSISSALGRRRFGGLHNSRSTAPAVSFGGGSDMGGDIILNPTAVKPKKKNNKMLVIGGIIIAMVLVIIVLSVILATKKNGGTGSKVIKKEELVKILKDNNIELAVQTDKFFESIHDGDVSIVDFKDDSISQVTEGSQNMEDILNALSPYETAIGDNASTVDLKNLKDTLSKRVQVYKYDSAPMSEQLHAAIKSGSASMLSVYNDQGTNVKNAIDKLSFYINNAEEVYSDAENNPCNDRALIHSQQCADYLQSLENISSIGSDTSLITALFDPKLNTIEGLNETSLSFEVHSLENFAGETFVKGEY